jgi:protein-tyrosine phosphatase
VSWLTERQRDGGIDEVRVDGAAGSLWLCGKHRIGPDPEGVVASVQASLVVCLTEAHELEGRYPTYVEWLRTDPRACWFPVPDLSVPDDVEWTALIAGVLHELRGGSNVIVHCAAGIGRAGTAACSVLLAAGVPLEAAEQRVAESRIGAGPQSRDQAAFIREWAESSPIVTQREQ